MSPLRCSPEYWEFLGQCTQCGHCTESCTSLTAADMTLGDIAKALLAAERESQSRDELCARIADNTQLVQAVRGCFFCTSCQNTCFAHNDVCKLIYHARIDFQDLGLIPRSAWTSVQVDQEWDIFTAYRAIYGIGFADLTRHVATEDHAAETNCEVAFFPGCALAAYAPELTREIFNTVEELGGTTTLIDHCCGSPLKSAGFYDRAEDLVNLIADEIEASGAKQVVCVCPGCVNEMTTILTRRGLDTQAVSLSSYLLEQGFSSKRELPATPLCFSKSCQDRDGTYLEETYQALGVGPETPAVFKGCCSAGGAVSAFDFNRQSEQIESKLTEVAEGATVITMCPTCTYTYAFDLMHNPRSIINKHYTELLFDHQFDWQHVFAQLESMWTGEYGAWLAEVFA